MSQGSFAHTASPWVPGWLVSVCFWSCKALIEDWRKREGRRDLSLLSPCLGVLVLAHHGSRFSSVPWPLLYSATSYWALATLFSLCPLGLSVLKAFSDSSSWLLQHSSLAHNFAKPSVNGSFIKGFWIETIWVESVSWRTLMNWHGMFPIEYTSGI